MRLFLVVSGFRAHSMICIESATKALSTWTLNPIRRRSVDGWHLMAFAWVIDQVFRLSLRLYLYYTLQVVALRKYNLVRQSRRGFSKLQTNSSSASTSTSFSILNPHFLNTLQLPTFPLSLIAKTLSTSLSSPQFRLGNPHQTFNINCSASVANPFPHDSGSSEYPISGQGTTSLVLT